MLNNHLSILRPGGEAGELQKIARSNGVVPVLWEILLVDAVPASSMELLQVLGEARAGTSIVADASQSLARFRHFVALLAPLAPTNRVPALRRYLDGVQQHLGEVVATWTLRDESAPVWCIDLAELANAGPDLGEATLVAQCATLGSRWRAQWDLLERTLAAGDFSAIEQRLNAPALNLDCTDWKAWAGQFGLALFKHGYFDRAFRGPLDGEYADYEYDALGNDAHLGDGLYRFKSQGRWGVSRRAGDGEQIVLDAQWDRVLRGGPDERERVWIKRDGLLGLAAIAGADAGRVLLQPMLDEAGTFSDGVAVACVDGKCGFITRGGTWHLPPCWDEAWPFSHGYAAVVVDDRLGYIDMRGIQVIPAQFDAADDFTAAGVACVRQGDRYGLIRADGSFAAPLCYRSLRWSDEFPGWIGDSGESAPSKLTLLRPDGSAWVDGWDSIEVMVTQHSLRVRSDQGVGLLRWNGQPLLDCAYDDLQVRFSTDAAVDAQEPHCVQFIARLGDRSGLIDASGAQLVPFEFSAIESLEPHLEEGHVLHRRGLLRVWSLPGRNKPLVGVWDIARGSCVVPCHFDDVWLMWRGHREGHCFVVITENPRGERGVAGKYRIGMLADDGSTLVPQDYAWIGEYTALNREEAIHHLRGAVYYAWSRDQPVAAATQRNGPSVWIHADGRVTATRTR